MKAPPRKERDRRDLIVKWFAYHTFRLRTPIHESRMGHLTFIWYLNKKGLVNVLSQDHEQTTGTVFQWGLHTIESLKDPLNPLNQQLSKRLGEPSAKKLQKKILRTSKYDRFVQNLGHAFAKRWEKIGNRIVKPKRTKEKER